MNKKILVSVMMLMMAVLMVAAMSLSVSAIAGTQTINLTFPTSSTFITGDITLRAEVNGSNYTLNAGTANGLANISGVTFQYSTDGGTTWYVFVTNRSNINNGSLSNWTIVVDTLNLSDVNVTRWRALAGNGTNGNNTKITSAVATAVTVDNTVPVISFASAANSVFSTDLATFTATVVNASTCRVKFGTDNRLDFSMTKSSDTCTYTLNKNTIPDETYSVTVTGNDGINSTPLARSFAFSLRSGDVVTGQVGAKAVVEAAQTAQQQSQKQKYLIIGGAVVLIFLMLKGKK